MDPIEMLRQAHGERLGHQIQETHEARDAARRWRGIAIVLAVLAVIGWAGQVVGR